MDPVGAVIAVLAMGGIAGLMALGLAERLLPIIPSYGMLTAIGAASAEGAWPLWLEVAATTLGGLAGLALGIGLLRYLGHARAQALFAAVSRPLGLREDRADAWATRLRASTATIAFTFQLIPTVRFVAPLLAVLVGMGTRRFLLASAFGVTLWNAAFIGIGYAASSLVAIENTTSLALAVVTCLLLIQLAVFGVLCRLRRGTGWLSAGVH